MKPSDSDEALIKATIGERKIFNQTVYLAPYDPRWRDWYDEIEAKIKLALGSLVLRLEHVGSTSVPGLMAKPIIDLVLEIPDSSMEASYVPHLEEHGFILHIREPDWYEHRLLKPPQIKANLHVFSKGCCEVNQMVLFRERLRHHEKDRLYYEKTKRTLAARVWKYRQHYADAKSAVIKEILQNAGIKNG